MERLTLRYKDAERTIATLKEIMEQPFSIIVRDAAIQRFEYTFEALWKLLKEYLKVHEGSMCNSPKSCFREGLACGLITDDETMVFLEMTDDRNMTSHTYKEEVSQMLYDKMCKYYKIMEKLLGYVRKNI